MTSGWSQEGARGGRKSSILVLAYGSGEKDLAEILPYLKRDYNIITESGNRDVSFCSAVIVCLSDECVGGDEVVTEFVNKAFAIAATYHVAVVLFTKKLEHVMCIEAFRSEETRHAVRQIIQYGTAGDHQGIAKSLRAHFPQMADGYLPVFNLGNYVGAVMERIRRTCRTATQT